MSPASPPPVDMPATSPLMSGLDPLVVAMLSQGMQPQQQSDQLGNLAQQSEADLADAHTRAQALQQGADQTLQQYQQAAGQAAPNVYRQNPGVTALGGALANVAAQLTGSQQPVQQNLATLQQHQQTIDAHRTENLAALADAYKLRAQAAQHAGDLEGQMKYRALHDRTLANIAKLKADAAQQSAITGAGAKLGTAQIQGSTARDVANIRGSWALKAAQVRQTATHEPMTLPDGTQSVVNTIYDSQGNGYKWADGNNLTLKTREALSTGGANGQPIKVLTGPDADRMHEVENARRNVDEVYGALAATFPRDPAGRVLATPGITMAKLFQSDPSLGSYTSWRTAAINILRATAGSKGLRINQAEISAAIKSDIPQPNDTIEVAQQKMRNINAMLDNGMMPYVTSDWNPALRKVQVRSAAGNIAYVTREQAKQFVNRPGFTVLSGSFLGEQSGKR